METEKPILKRVLVCFCAFLICMLVVFCAFSIPKLNVYADDVYYEQYLADIIDNKKGSSTGTSWGLVLDAAQWAVGEALKNPIYAGGSVSLSDITTFQGYYNYNSSMHLCLSYIVGTGDITLGDRNIIAESDDFSINAIITADNPVSRYYYTSRVQTSSCYVKFCAQMPSSVKYYGSVEGGGDIFPNYSSVHSGDRSVGISVAYGTRIPNLTDNMNTSNYVYFGLSTASYIIAGYPDISSICTPGITSLGLSDYTFNDFSDVIDWTVNTFNPWVEIEYPDYIQYLYYPPEIPSETTMPGCGCHVDVYVEPTVIVNVEPTIIINNDIEFPSDWQEDYTYPSIPAHETIPFPTQDGSNTEPVTMPTMDVDEYKQTYGNAIEFWFYVAWTFIERMGLELLTTFAFVLSVVGFIMWKLGSGGGKHD